LLIIVNQTLVNDLWDN
jgi:hypothetical protein